ncbi:MAG: hypothetical protein IKK47_01660 [Ruminococcus sp.]|nr:hypothetical protein [Ruminococcus sp.]
MSDTSNFTKNAEALRKCNKIFNIIPIIYIALFAVYFLVSGLFLICVNYSAIYSLIDALIFAPLTCYLGLRGAYHKHDLAAIAVPAISIFNVFVLKYGASLDMTYDHGSPSTNVTELMYKFCIVIFIISAVLAYINLNANNKFRFLEKQVGFPYFNVRYEEQRVNKIRHEIKDPFQKEFERRMRTSTSEMSGIEFPEALEITDL